MYLLMKTLERDSLNNRSKRMQPQVDLLYKVMVERFDGIDSKVDKLESKVDDLCNFKWKVIGFSSCVVGIISMISYFIK